MLSVKWVVTNKGTPKAPVPKARLVAREFVSNALDRDTLFSGTPGLAIARSLISKAATCRSPKEKLKIMLLDTAALHGVPQEDPRSSNPNLVARLIKSLYGTRDATQLWARHVGKTLRGLGYAETKGAPGVYYHKEKDVEITLHVDDFLVVGEEEHLLELKTALEKVYKLKGKVLGPDEDDIKEGVYLGRRHSGAIGASRWRATRSRSRSCSKPQGWSPGRRFQEDRLSAQRVDSGRSEVVQTWYCFVCIHLAGSWRHQCCNMSSEDKNGYTNSIRLGETEESVPLLERKSPVQVCISLASKRGREAQVADRLRLGE